MPFGRLGTHVERMKHFVMLTVLQVNLIITRWSGSINLDRVISETRYSDRGSGHPRKVRQTLTLSIWVGIFVFRGEF